MKKFKHMLALGAAMLCMAVFVFPMTVFAKADTEPPEISVQLDGGTLHIEASDADSGVEAVYIDGTRVNTLVNGKANVLLKDYAGNGKQVSIYAVDGAGNRSKTAAVDNPYYQAPAALSTSSPPAHSAPQPPPAASTPSSSSTPAGGGSPPASFSAVGTDSSEPSASTVPDGGNPLTPDGQGTVVDHVTDADGKEFYTIVTPDGNVFYLVVDHEKGEQNVYFLNAVTESDLMALAEKEGDGPGESAIPAPVPTSEPGPGPESEPEPPQEPEKEGGGMGTIILVLLAMAAVGGAGWYFKIYRPKQQAALPDDMDEEENEDNGDGIRFEDEEPLPDEDDQQDSEEYQLSDYNEQDAEEYRSGDGAEYDEQ